MGLDTIPGEVIAGVLVVLIASMGTVVWRKVHSRPAPQANDKAMQLLKALREQIRGKSGYTVVASEPATQLGMEPGSHELDRCLHDLVRDGYLQESANALLTAQYVYQITPAGMDAADAY